MELFNECVLSRPCLLVCGCQGNPLKMCFAIIIIFFLYQNPHGNLPAAGVLDSGHHGFGQLLTGLPQLPYTGEGLACPCYSC